MILTDKTKLDPAAKHALHDCIALAPLVDPRLSVSVTSATLGRVALVGPAKAVLAEGTVAELREMLISCASLSVEDAEIELREKLFRRIPSAQAHLARPRASGRERIEEFLQFLIQQRENVARLNATINGD